MKEILITGCAYYEAYMEQKDMYTFFNYSQSINELWEDVGFRIIKIL